MQSYKENSQLHRYIYIAVLCAHGIIIGLLERSIPSFFFFAPGAKLGLANIITIVSLFTLDTDDAFFLMIIRLILTTLLGGTVSTFLFSFAGAFLSFFTMLFLKKFYPKHLSLIGISSAGGIMHNVGQLLVASLFAKSLTVMLYLPILSFVGILAGIGVGITANYILKHVRVLNLLSKNLKKQIS